MDIPALAQADLESQPFIEDPYVCVLRRGHPHGRKRMTLPRLLALNHVAVSRRRGGRTVVDLALNKLGERLRPVMRFPHYAAAFHVIETTDFALIVPLSLARLHDVEIVQLPLTGLNLTLHLYWRRDTDRDPASVWARGQLVAAVKGQCRAADQAFLWGPRQTGKTTLLRERFPESQFYELLDSQNLDALHAANRMCCARSSLRYRRKVLSSADHHRRECRKSRRCSTKCTR